MTELSADEKHRLIAKTYGLSFMQRRDALDLAETEEFGGDVVLAIAYLGDRGRASQMFASGQRHAIEAARKRAAIIRPSSRTSTSPFRSGSCDTGERQARPERPPAGRVGDGSAG